MRRSSRVTRRRLCFMSSGILVLFLAVAGPDPLRASPPTPLGYFGGTALSSSISIHTASDAFSDIPVVNFGIPYSTASLDSAPSAAATGTYLDTGQLVQFLASQGGKTQPQYASSRYPGSAQEAKATVVDETDPTGQFRIEAATATSRTSETLAQAASSVFGLTSPPPSNPTPDTGASRSGPGVQLQSSFRSLSRALNQIRAARGLPSVAVSNPGETLKVAKLTTQSQVREQHGRVLVETEAVADGVALGGGVVRIRSVKAVARVVTDGVAASSEPYLEIADASVGGFPVRITADGIKIADNDSPFGPEDLADLNTQINQALSDSGWRIRTLGSDQTNEGASGSALVLGIGIGWESPVPSNSGLPGLGFAVVIGKAEADVYGSRAAIARAPNASADDDDSDISPGFQYGGIVTTPGTAVQPPPADTPSLDSRALGASSPRRGGGLVALFGVWQLSIVATVFEAVRLRRLRRGAEPPGDGR
ncbi:MAG: hypothetical protein WDA27_08005 [Actinomycetota bacterium]